MPTVRKLNEEGLARYSEYLTRIAAGERLDPPLHLLNDADASTALSGKADIEQRTFNSKKDAAEYLREQLAPLDKTEIENNVGVWSWLSLFYFDHVCPPSAYGVRKPGELARHILNLHSQKYYRHLLAGPYRLVQVHGDRSRIFLCGELPVHGDFSEQLASRMQLISNPSLIEAVDCLYFDPSSNGDGRPKRGATTRTRPGNLRRFIAMMQQFDLTYDMYAMTARQILDLLPREFNSWHRGT